MRSDDAPLPAANADIEQWVLWVDCHVPYRGMADGEAPGELRVLTRYPDRVMAALFARLWFSMKSRSSVHRPRPPQEPQQAALYGESW
jgi:hypothetical protein